VQSNEEDLDSNRLDDWQLAERLSYFLTSGPPDESLRQAAADGELRDNAGRRRHASRLLSGESAGPMVRAFVTQWLGLDSLRTLMPDPSLLKRFTQQHRDGLIEEPIETIRRGLRENRPVTELIWNDRVWTNVEVAEDIDQIDVNLQISEETKPGRLVSMSVGSDGRRGGLLSMPGLVMASANGVDTQPVLRGVWALENILGMPIPEPPTNVPALTPDTSAATTLKERLAAHTSDASCASCHRHIDPVGFVLENFDAIEKWRDHYPTRSDASGSENRDRGSPRGLPPPTPPGIRVRTTAVRLVKLSCQVVPEAAGRPVPPTPCRARRNSRLENGCCASCLDGYQRFVQQDPCRHPTSATL